MPSTFNLPLEMKIPKILKWLESLEKRNIYEREVYEMYQGQLLPYIERSMQYELSADAFNRSKHRIPPINLLKKLIDKTSKSYHNAPVRTCDNPIDQELVELYEELFDLTKKLQFADKMINLHKYFAIELYLNHSDKPSIRILSADQFKVWSDSYLDPNEPTVFIKFMGRLDPEDQELSHEGEKLYQPGEKTDAPSQLLYLYTAYEFLIIEASENRYVIRRDLMELAGNPEGINPLGRIPFVYAKLAENELIPMCDTDTQAMAILVPKLLADLNYAVQYNSHSVFYGIDVEVGELSYNPDTFVQISSVEGTNKSPSIGTMTPTLAVDSVLSLAQAEAALWLTTRGAKVASVGQLSTDNYASGISKIIDESDVTSYITEIQEKWKSWERDLWDLVARYHNILWFQLVDRKSFSSELEVDIDFEDFKPIQDDTEKLNYAKTLFDMGIYSKAEVLRYLNNEISDEEIARILDQIEEPEVPESPVEEVEPMEEQNGNDIGELQ